MKANKAPEKIYISPLRNYSDGYVGVAWDEPHKTMVEYTRTDAFIEKACEWLSDNLQTIVDVDFPSKHHVESIPALGIITQTEFIKKFKKEIMFLLD